MCSATIISAPNFFKKAFSFQRLLFCFISILIFSSCENDMKEVNEITKRKEAYPSEVIKEFDLLYTDSGSVRMHMKAPIMKHYTVNIKEPYEEMEQGVYIEFYNDSGFVKSTLRSNYAIRYDQTHKMEAKNKVVVINESGERLTTEHLIWDETTRKIRTNGHVMINTNKETLEGEGMVANEDFSEWEILKPIGKKMIEEKDTLK